MNNVSEIQKKDRVLKSLAVGGFIGLIVVVAWLGVKAVSVMPAAFNSLASLAESVYHYKPVELVTVTDKSTINSGESVSISWSVPDQKGTFAFSYNCADGVSIDLHTDSGIKNTYCNTKYNVGATDNIELVVYSEKNRFADLGYAIDFIPTRATEPTATKENTLAIINPAIGIAQNPTTPVQPVVTPVTPEPETSTTTTPTPVTPTEPVVTPVTPKPTTPAPAPVYVQEYTYAIPTSNPNGYSDLSATFLSIGTLDSANRFTRTYVIDNDSKGAVQFEVKNIGTKTSAPWSFTAVLPNGDTYISNEQTGLKPNERSVLTIGFTLPDDTGVEALTVSAVLSADTNKTNNTFSTKITISE